MHQLCFTIWKLTFAASGRLIKTTCICFTWHTKCDSVTLYSCSTVFFSAHLETNRLTYCLYCSQTPGGVVGKETLYPISITRLVLLILVHVLLHVLVLLVLSHQEPNGIWVVLCLWCTILRLLWHSQELNAKKKRKNSDKEEVIHVHCIWGLNSSEHGVLISRLDERKQWYNKKNSRTVILPFVTQVTHEIYRETRKT